MKRIFLLIVMITFLTACQSQIEPVIEPVIEPKIEDDIILVPPTPFEYPSGYIEFDHLGVTRKYIMHVPENLIDNAPIVFVLHGYTGFASMMSLTNIEDVADEFGFVVIYPQGLVENRVTHWNADLDISDNDDVGFLVSLSNFLHTEYGFSDENVFSTGFSNGGFMSYTLACKASEKFMAIASMSGVMSGETWDTCEPESSVPVLHIHGLGDSVVPVDGSMNTIGGWGGAPDLDTIIEYWKMNNDVSMQEEIVVSDAVLGRRYTSLNNTNQVWYYTIEGYGHSWPNDSSNEVGLNASELMWEFFSQFIE